MGGIWDPPSPPDYDDGPPEPEPCCPVYFRDCRQAKHELCDRCVGCLTCELASQPAPVQHVTAPLDFGDEDEVCPF